MNKTVILIFLIIVVLTVGFYCFQHIVFKGAFDKKYTREELSQNFIQNENNFLELVTFFNNHLPEDNGQTVLFGLGEHNTISLVVSPAVIDPLVKRLGGTNLTFNSPQLDSALNALGWSQETVKLLKDKLSSTNCHWISTTDYFGGSPVKIYPYQSGWGAYAYLIFDEPLSDTLIKIHGNTISNSKFGKRAVLNYSSAL